MNTGAFDAFHALADARDDVANTWIHVDGAFGLWAAVPESLRHLVDGVERADSWATDAHKWLNVPYDSGVAFTAHPGVAQRRLLGPRCVPRLRRETRDQIDWNPEHSRRARGFAVYAAIREPRTQRDRGDRRALLQPRAAIRRGSRAARAQRFSTTSS